MKHTLFRSVDEMLTLESLSHLAGMKISSLKRIPYAPRSAFSGSIFTSIETNSGEGPSYFLKEISYERDWMMRHSNDRFCRSTTLWQAGLLDRLKPEIEHGVVACVKGESDKEHSWAILMHDVSAGNMSGRPISRDQHQQILDATAALHATFWESPEIKGPGLGIASHRDILSVLMVQTSIDDPGPFTDVVPTGWSMLMEMVAPDVAELLDTLMREPQPLCDALARYPYTLLHGDWNTSNMSLKPNAQMETVVFDWQLASIGAATMDLLWYLTMSSIIYEGIAEEESIAYYRQSLARRLGARFDDSWWLPMVDLSYLDIIVREGSYHAWGTVYAKEERTRVVFQRMVHKYDEQVRTASKWL